MQKKILVEKAQLKKKSQVRAWLVYIAYETLVVLIKYTVDPIPWFCFDCLFVFFLFFFFQIRNQKYSQSLIYRFFFGEEKRQVNSIHDALTPWCAGVSTKDVFSHTDYSHCWPFAVAQWVEGSTGPTIRWCSPTALPVRGLALYNRV